MRLYSLHRWVLFIFDLLAILLAVSLFSLFSPRLASAQINPFIILAFCFSWIAVYSNNDFKLDYYTLALRTALLAASFVLLYLLWAQQRRVALLTLEVLTAWLTLAYITRFYLNRLGPRFKVLVLVEQGPPPELQEDRRMEYDYQSSTDRINLHHYDLMIIKSDSTYSEPARKLIAYARGRGLPVLFDTEFYEEQLGKISISCFQHPWLDHSFSVNWFYIKGRRLVDLLIVSIAAPTIIMVGLIITTGILISMGRPIFFSQKRVGQHHSIFKIYKFRSMIPATLATAGTKEDSHCPARITPLGHFLRRHRLDEIPQFFNILKGDMTLIGPRPDTIELAEQYSREIPVYNMRHLVKPGLTGWSQVRQGHTSTVKGTIEKLQYDLFYIKHFAFWLDFKIVLKTIHTLFTGFGAR